MKSKDVRVPIRSKRALAIDRAKNAKVRYKNFNSAYAESPNRSDVEDYDTIRKKGDIPPPEPEPTEEPIKKPEKQEEYVPKGEEKSKLANIFFNKLNIVEQRKDLLTTRNVVRNKKQLERWKKNPKDGDVRGIDTEPKELYDEKIKLVTAYVGNPQIRMKNFGLKTVAGDVAFGKRTRRGYIPDSEFAGDVRVDTSRGIKQTKITLAHELGHVYDRNVIGKRKRDESYKVDKKLGTLGTYPRTAGYVDFMSISSRDKKNSAEAFNQVKFFANDKANPVSDYRKTQYSYMKYRNSNPELFANWFSGFINNRAGARKYSKKYYNYFRKTEKDFFGKIKKTENKVVDKQLSTLKKLF